MKVELSEVIDTKRFSFEEAAQVGGRGRGVNTAEQQQPRRRRRRPACPLVSLALAAPCTCAARPPGNAAGRRLAAVADGGAHP